MVDFQGILDLLFIKNGQRIGVECKQVDAPRLTPSMHIAVVDLELSKLLVIYPSLHPFSLAENISAISLARLAERPTHLLDKELCKYAAKNQGKRVRSLAQLEEHKSSQAVGE
jgi:hypothetical protein